MSSSIHIKQLKQKGIDKKAFSSFYFAGNSLDLANENNGVYTLSDGVATFWTIDNGTVIDLGTASSIDSTTGTITFSSGYTLTTTGVIGHI